jgi:hypothetical protein
MPSARFEYKDFKSAPLYQGSGGRRKACRRSFTKTPEIVWPFQSFVLFLHRVKQNKNDGSNNKNIHSPRLGRTSTVRRDVSCG